MLKLIFYKWINYYFIKEGQLVVLSVWMNIYVYANL